MKTILFSWWNRKYILISVGFAVVLAPVLVLGGTVHSWVRCQHWQCCYSWTPPGGGPGNITGPHSSLPLADWLDSRDRNSRRKQSTVFLILNLKTCSWANTELLSLSLSLCLSTSLLIATAQSESVFQVFIISYMKYQKSRLNILSSKLICNIFPLVL